MPDATISVHPPPFCYHHPVYRAAAAEAKARSRHHCQLCGRMAPLEAHHWSRPPYPPPARTTAADLTALCRDCHIMQHLSCFFENAGGSAKTLCAAWSETVATLLLHQHLPGSPMRVGRAVRAEGQWVALVTGGRRPAIGEVFALFLISRRQWRTVAVTEVLDGQPGCWRVRKRFLRADEQCAEAIYAEQTAAAGMSQAVA